MGLFEDEGEADVKYEDSKIKRVAQERFRLHEKVTEEFAGFTLLHICLVGSGAPLLAAPYLIIIGAA